MTPAGPRPQVVWATPGARCGSRPYRCYASWPEYAHRGRAHRTRRVSVADYEAWLAAGVPYLHRRFDAHGYPLPRPDR